MTDHTEPTARGAELPRVVRTTVEITASPERVFDALTDARELAAWWAGDDAHTVDCEADARPGGAWHVRTVDRDGTERVFGGEYRVVDRPHRLEQTWQATEDAELSIVRYDLEPREVDGEDGTRLTITHTETLSLSARSAAAMRIGEARPSLRVRHRLLPAWFDRPGRVAWARRVLR